VPTINATPKSTKDGIGIATKQVTTIQVQSPTIEILVGGPYRSHGEEHTYGHVALRVITPDNEFVYDFGRYNGESGPFGQGRLRVWTKFTKYIAGENATGRTTTGFVYKIPAASAANINAHFTSLIGNRPVLKAYGDHMKEYRLAVDYHALNNNCTTTAMTGVRVAIRDLDFDVPTHNIGTGMSFVEKVGAKGAGWPSHIFMPADLQKMLENNPKHRPDKVEKYGGAK